MAKFKKGDEVLVKAGHLHSISSMYYPAIGSYGTVTCLAKDDTDHLDGTLWVKWGPNSGTMAPHDWNIPENTLRKVTKKDRNRAVQYYTRYVFAPALNNRNRYGSIFTSVEMAYVKPSENKLRAEREIKQRMQEEGGVDYRVIYANCQNFATAYVAENILVVDTKTATYRYDLDFCRNEYTKRALGIKEMQAKVDAAMEVCNCD